MTNTGASHSNALLRRLFGPSRRACAYLAGAGLVLTSFVLESKSAKALTAGDVAIIGVRSDDIDGPSDADTGSVRGNGNDDAIAWVPLADLPAGTEIFFTDAGWTAGGSFRAKEGAIKYTAPAGGLVAGTVMLLEFTPKNTDLGVGAYTFTPQGSSGTYSQAESAAVGTTGLLPSKLGDQVHLFEGSASSPQFLWSWKNEGSYDGTSTSNDTSALPTGLAFAMNAISVGNGTSTDNNRYVGTTSGTKAQLAAALANPANWEAAEDFPFPSGGNDITNGMIGAGLSFTILPPVTNRAPIVTLVRSLSVQLSASATLSATVTDDGLPAMPGFVSVEWRQVSGPGATTFGDATSASTTARHTRVGRYVLRLTANDGSLTGSADVIVNVIENEHCYVVPTRDENVAVFCL